MQENLWKRMNVLVKKHPNLFEKCSLGPPFVYWGIFFQAILPLALTITMFRLSVENLSSED